MSWTATVEGRLFVLTEKGMIDGLVEHYYNNDLVVGERFAEWVNETYTPWDALNDDLDRALWQWAEETVLYRRDIVEELLPWAHWEPDGTDTDPPAEGVIL